METVKAFNESQEDVHTIENGELLLGRAMEESGDAGQETRKVEYPLEGCRLTRDDLSTEKLKSNLARKSGVQEKLRPCKSVPNLLRHDGKLRACPSPGENNMPVLEECKDRLPDSVVLAIQREKLASALNEAQTCLRRIKSVSCVTDDINVNLSEWLASEEGGQVGNINDEQSNGKKVYAGEDAWKAEICYDVRDATAQSEDFANVMKKDSAGKVYMGRDTVTGMVASEPALNEISGFEESNSSVDLGIGGMEMGGRSTPNLEAAMSKFYRKSRCTAGAPVYATDVPRRLKRPKGSYRNRLTMEEKLNMYAEDTGTKIHGDGDTATGSIRESLGEERGEIFENSGLSSGALVCDGGFKNGDIELEDVWESDLESLGRDICLPTPNKLIVESVNEVKMMKTPTTRKQRYRKSAASTSKVTAFKSPAKKVSKFKKWFINPILRCFGRGDSSKTTHDE